MSAHSWVIRLLERHGLLNPDGRHLFAYRVTQEEFHSLKDVLIATLPRRDAFMLNPETRAAFCLYAAEWWRRNHEGGPWKWGGIIRSLEWTGEIDFPRFYKRLEEGFRYWRIRALALGDGSRAFLVTLACEGGLPLRLVANQGAALRRYFRAVFDDYEGASKFGAAGLECAERAQGFLPSSLRHFPVYELSGELVEQLWPLRSLLRDTAEPVKQLDGIQPKWRDNLPLSLDDDTAGAFLSGLVSMAVQAGQRSTAQLRLLNQVAFAPDGPILARSVRVPSRLSAQELARVLGVGLSDLPRRVQLRAVAPNGLSQPVCVATQMADERAGAFALESWGGRNPVKLVGGFELAQIGISAGDGGGGGPAAVLLGGMSLEEAPWVLGPSDAPGSWDLLATGGCHSRAPTVLLVLPEGAEPTNVHGEITCLGAVQNCPQHRAFQLTGTCDVVDSGCTYEISAGVLSAKPVAEYGWMGDTWHGVVGKLPVYKGFPRLLELEADCCKEVPPAELEWRGPATGQRWVADPRRALGCVDVRRTRGGRTVFRARLNVAPGGSQVRLQSGKTVNQGGIQIEGLKQADLVLRTPGCFLRPDNDVAIGRYAVESQVPAPPPLDIEVRWPDGSRLTFCVPFPSAGAWFMDRAGARQPDGAAVRLDKLAGVMAQAASHRPSDRFLLHGRLVAEDATLAGGRVVGLAELNQLGDGTWTANLAELQGELERWLALSSEMDARIDLGIDSLGGGGRPSRLKVTRYDGVLEPDEARTAVRLVAPSWNETEKRQLVLRARPLWMPRAQPEELQLTDDGVWGFPSEGRESGPWLIAAHDGDWCRTRPLLWTVGAAPEESQDAPGTLGACVRIFKNESRRRAMRALLQRLAKDFPSPWGQETWDEVRGYLETLGDLPATTFDVVVELGRAPCLAALAFLTTRGTRQSTLWSELKGLGLFWPLVGCSHWEGALRHLLASVGQLPEHLHADTKRYYQGQLLGIQTYSHGTALIAAHAASEVGLLSHVPPEVMMCATAPSFLAGRLRDDWRECRARLGNRLQGRVLDSIPAFVERDIRRHTPASLHEALRADGPADLQGLYLAPLAAGVCAAANIDCPKDVEFQIAQAEFIEPIWFGQAHASAVALVLGAQHAGAKKERS